ncbi:hypothetical protein F5Y06DRAFT_2408 [Hypoxylon sp. FL0890]|nr:hypothetical protein F5Y06DRAFT_2408 [Hypoxylon sp. FL0890]
MVFEMADHSRYEEEGSGTEETETSSDAYVSAVSSLESLGMEPLPPPRTPPTRGSSNAISTRPGGGGAPLHSRHSSEASDDKEVSKSHKNVNSVKLEGTSKGKEVVRNQTQVKDEGPASEDEEPANDIWQAKGKEVARSRGSASDEEARLLNASSSFDDQVGPLVNQPSVPHSIRPTTYQYGGGVAFPARRTQALTPVGGSSLSSYTSNALTSYSSLPVEGEDDNINPGLAVRNRIAMASHFIDRSSGMPMHLISQHTRMMSEISHGVTAAINHVCRERDDARREVQHYMRTEDAAKAECGHLRRELNRMMSRENGLKKDMDRYRDRANKLKLELDNLERDARRFQEHHEKMAEEWDERDAQQFKHVQALEGELKRLRTRNAELAEKAGEEPEDVTVLRPDFSSPSVPESHEQNALPASPGKKDADSKKVLLNMLKDKYGKVTGDEEPKHVPFCNPNGPKWNAAAATSSTQRPPTMVAGSTQGNPSNWPAVVRGEKSGLARYAEAGHGRTTVVHRGPSHAGPSTQPPPMASSIAQHKDNTSIARHKDNWELGDIVGAIDHLEQLTKGYIVQCHPAEEPPKVENRLLPLQERATWQYLLHLISGPFISGPQAHNHMVYLMSVSSFRPYIIMRLALDYLHKKIISPQLFLGLDEGMDNHLRALQARIGTFTHMATFSGGRERQIVVNDHARIIRHAFKDGNLAPRMAKFRETSINYHTQVLSEVLKPLRAMSVQDDAAFRAVRIMVAGTWDISAKVWMSGMTLHFLFPDCGSKYGDGSMKAVNMAQFGVSSVELQFLQTRVCFAISPSLTVRDERDESNMICQRIRKSEVILMK